MHRLSYKVRKFGSTHDSLVLTELEQVKQGAAQGAQPVPLFP